MASHHVEVTRYCMDVRAFGKGYEQSYRRAVREGVRVVVRTPEAKLDPSFTTMEGVFVAGVSAGTPRRSGPSWR